MTNHSGLITSHVLDISRGKPAAGIPILLHVQIDAAWRELGRGVTNQDGRVTDLIGDSRLRPGRYRLTFETEQYLSAFGQPFFPEVSIIFDIHDAAQHYHMPLLLSPFGYSTYRGS